MRAARASFAHPLGGPAQVAALELPVPDIEEATDAYARTLGIEFSDIDPRSAHAIIGRQEVRLRHGAPLWNPAVIEIDVDRGPGAASAAPYEVDAVGLRWRIRG